MVDIWSLGVVVLQYGYGLPWPSQEPKGKPWCRDIVQKAKEGEGEGDTLMDLISTKMLRMDYRHRGSASDCLEEVYRLGFHEIQTVDIGRTTPTGKTAGRDGVTKSNSVVVQPLQHAPSDKDVSSGFYDIEGTSASTEIAPSKRDLRDGIHFYNRASQRSLEHAQGPTQIWNPQTEDSLTSTLSKQPRPQVTQSPTADTSGRGRSKRSRALISCEAGADSSKPSKRKGHDPATQPRQVPQLNLSKGPLATDVASLTQAVEPIPRMPHTTKQVTRTSTQKRTRSPLKRASTPATEVSLREVETPSSKRNIHDNVRAMLAGNLGGENESKAKVHHPQ